MRGKAQRSISARQRLAFQIRAIRQAAALSQETLGDLAGLHRTYIGSIERGERNVSIDNVERIAGALGVDILDLLAHPPG